jgi:hypothetical protein
MGQWNIRWILVNIHLKWSTDKFGLNLLGLFLESKIVGLNEKKMIGFGWIWRIVGWLLPLYEFYPERQWIIYLKLELGTKQQNGQTSLNE